MDEPEAVLRMRACGTGWFVTTCWALLWSFRHYVPRYLGARSLRKAVNEYVEHYHHERNHQGLDNRIPMPDVVPDQDVKGPIAKSERLGGLLKYYYRESETEK